MLLDSSSDLCLLRLLLLLLLLLLLKMHERVVHIGSKEHLLRLLLLLLKDLLLIGSIELLLLVLEYALGYHRLGLFTILSSSKACRNVCITWLRSFTGELKASKLFLYIARVFCPRVG